MSAKNAKGTKSVKDIKIVQAEKSAKTVLELSAKEALDFFMRSSSYCRIPLPPYIDFGKILLFIKTIVGETDGCKILKESKIKPGDKEKASYTFFMNKDEKHTYRPITLVNPYLYYSLVRDLTKKENWNQIQNRFQELQNKKCTVYSIPLVDEEKNEGKESISFWWEMVEQQSIELSLKYKYMFVSDIANCYPSVYTHSIAWALMGKEEAKKRENRENKALLCNIIDSSIQHMQYRQTNGLPQGCRLFDLVAELILAYADNQLYKRLSKEKVGDYRIIRYRDDYRIFGNSKEKLEKIALVLQEVLAELNFQLNKAKTKLSEHVIESAIKQDKLDYILTKTTHITNGKGKEMYVEQLQKEFLFILLFSKKYPDSGRISRLMDDLNKSIHRKSIKELTEKKIWILSSIVVEIAIRNPRTYGLAASILSVFINYLTKDKEKEKLIRAIVHKFSGIPHVGYMELWLQRITITMHLKKRIAFKEPLCKIVAKEILDDVFWDNDWVAEKFLKDFPLYSICDDEKQKACSAIIAAKEVADIASSGG